MTENERRYYNEGIASVWKAIAKVTPRKGDYTLIYNAVHGVEKYPNGFKVKIDSMSESEGL